VEAVSSWKFYIVTFGCKVNQYESQSLREAWERFGGEECECPEVADVICINSCAVTAKGERDARNAVFRLRRDAPSARLILTGCATKFFAGYRPRKGSNRTAPDILLPQDKKSLLLADPRTPAMLADMSDTAPDAFFPPFRINSFKRARPVVKVQDGCTHRCTFCVVPHTRGPAKSRQASEVLAEIRRLLRAGHAEIMLSGVNLHQYGRDNPDFGDFWSLLSMLETKLADEFAGISRFRISSLEPSQLTRRGLDTLAASRMVCPHLHLSLQHVSPAVLRRMGRGHYSARNVAEAVAALAELWPVMGLGADILVGFPGETETDMSLLTDFVRELPFSYAHVFPWSCRPDTAAAGFDGQMPVAVRQTRAARVREVVAQRRKAFLQRQLALDHMLIATDGLKTATESLKGVNEYYISCVFDSAPKKICAFRKIGLVPAKPVGLTGSGLVVEAVYHFSEVQ
jgi:MiaB/RimO family radical SAM methylthiotransferase